MKTIILSCLCLCSLASCNFSTSFRLTSRQFSANHDFYEGLTVQLLKVDSNGADGFPVKYTVERTYATVEPRYLPDNEAAELLPGHIKTEFLKYVAIKDSIIKHKINDTLLFRDTVSMEGGGIMYRQPGIHRSIEWDKAYDKTDNIKFRHIPDKKIRSFKFAKNTKRYRWKTSAGEAWPGKENINGFRLIPGRWYRTAFPCRYGILTDGTCTLYFQADEKGKIACKREDKKNDGPF